MGEPTRGQLRRLACPQGRPDPAELLATAYWTYDATLMAEVAAALGREQEAEEYEVLAGEIGQAFRKSYVGPTARSSPARKRPMSSPCRWG